MEPYFKHPAAIVETTHVGSGTRVWAFAHILPGAHIGRDCNICDHVFIENEVTIGDRVTIKCGVQLWDGVTLEDDVFIGPNATFTNDPFPRSRQRPERWKPTFVRRGASIGANATILPGITIGPEAMVGAGAVVTRDVPARCIVVGNPARIHGYANAGTPLTAGTTVGKGGIPEFKQVIAVKAYPMPIITDLRGSISVGEIGKNLPFDPRRFFVLFNVPGREVRGEHAHRACHQFLVCVKGQVTLLVDDGTAREQVLLDSPAIGVHIPPMIWAAQYAYSEDAVLLVLASDVYDPDDYIRDYSDFLSARCHRLPCSSRPEE